jgi:hypothetical protein
VNVFAEGEGVFDSDNAPAGRVGRVLDHRCLLGSAVRAFILAGVNEVTRILTAGYRLRGPNQASNR